MFTSESLTKVACPPYGRMPGKGFLHQTTDLTNQTRANSIILRVTVHASQMSVTKQLDLQSTGQMGSDAECRSSLRTNHQYHL